MKAKPKLFTVSARNPEDENPPETRLLRAQTQRQVEKFLENEALAALYTKIKIEVATVDEAVELGAAGIKVESIEAE